MSEQQPQDDELKAFLIVLRQGLLVIVRYIEKRYDIGEASKGKRAA